MTSLSPDTPRPVKLPWVSLLCGAVLVIYGSAGLVNFGFNWYRTHYAFQWMNGFLLAGILATGLGLMCSRSWARWCALGIFMFYFLSGGVHASLNLLSQHGLPQTAKPAWMTGMNICMGGLGYFFLSRQPSRIGQSQWRMLGMAVLISLGIFIVLGLSAVQGS